MSKNKIYKGIIVEESLDEKSFLNMLQSLSTKKVGDWTLNTVLISKHQIEELPGYMANGPWYAHFWHGNEILVVFKDYTFKLISNKPETWRPAIGHGISIGIPRTQLNFIIDWLCRKTRG